MARTWIDSLWSNASCTASIAERLGGTPVPVKTQATPLYPFVPSGPNFALALDFFAALGFERTWAFAGMSAKGAAEAMTERSRKATPRLTVVTLGVSNVARSRRFYCEGLGFVASSATSEHIVFIDAGDVVLGLYPRDLLAEDAQVSAKGSGFGGITLARNVGTKGEVDAAIDAARKAGAKILKPAQEVFWGGYSGYFADPDGHPWEVAYNPHWKLDGKGRVLLPR